MAAAEVKPAQPQGEVNGMLCGKIGDCAPGDLSGDPLAPLVAALNYPLTEPFTHYVPTYNWMDPMPIQYQAPFTVGDALELAGALAPMLKGATVLRLATVEDVLANPSMLRGLNPAQLGEQLGRVPAGWRIEALGKGAHQGQGYVLREYLPNGEASGRMIRWHPGGGRHGPDPYWTVRQPNVPTVRLPGGH